MVVEPVAVVLQPIADSPLVLPTSTPAAPAFAAALAPAFAASSGSLGVSPAPLSHRILHGRFRRREERTRRGAGLTLAAGRGV